MVNLNVYPSNSCIVMEQLVSLECYTICNTAVRSGHGHQPPIIPQAIVAYLGMFYPNNSNDKKMGNPETWQNIRNINNSLGIFFGLLTTLHSRRGHLFPNLQGNN